MNFNIKSITEYNKRSEEILQQIYLHFYQNNSLEVDFDYDLKNFRQSDKDFVMFDIVNRGVIISPLCIYLLEARVPSLQKQAPLAWI